jgi:predicted aspartyl protease
MGDGRAQVMLTNIIDEELMQQGQLSPQQVRTHEANAQVDTGAVYTALPVDVVYHLGLRIRGQRVAEYADGWREAVDMVGPVGVKVRGRKTIEEALVLGDEGLIGQTVREKLDLRVDAASHPRSDGNQGEVAVGRAWGEMLGVSSHNA